LTTFPGEGYLSKLDSKRANPRRRVTHEADIQSAESEAQEQARISCPHEDEGRTEDAEPAPEAGSQASRGVRRREVIPAAPKGGGESLPRVARIRRSGDIQSLLERGKRKRMGHLDIFFAPSPVSRSRLGLIVPKHGRSIVARNKVKRRLREIGRRRILPALHAADVSMDILLRARWKAYEADFVVLAEEVHEALEELWSDAS